MHELQHIQKSIDIKMLDDIREHEFYFCIYNIYEIRVLRIIKTNSSVTDKSDSCTDSIYRVY